MFDAAYSNFRSEMLKQIYRYRTTDEFTDVNLKEAADATLLRYHRSWLGRLREDLFASGVVCNAGLKEPFRAEDSFVKFDRQDWRRLEDRLRFGEPLEQRAQQPMVSVDNSQSAVDWQKWGTIVGIVGIVLTFILWMLS